MPAQAKIERVARAKLELATNAVVVRRVGVVEPRAQDVHVAVVVVVESCETAPHRIRERTAHSTFESHLRELARRHLNVTVELVRRLPGHEMDYATGRIAPEQRALGALEHFHALEVIELEAEPGQVG